MHMEGVEIAGGAYSIITYPKNVVSWFSKLDDISFFYEKFRSIASCYTRKNGESGLFIPVKKNAFVHNLTLRFET